ncbi:phosphate ABC transporter permease [Natronobiforma cellulositropha]|uniref:phosphate ABC transporter permease n=1 Tax=Natronobiforma cellulositropha TaxID=1679076 RepID=UPI0021D5EF3A|nr:phosphate ABC transporter permease [Natronobiforma cellulositropha]
MVDIVTAALIASGLVLLFAGAALSVYGVVLLGTVLGGGGGYLLAPTVGGVVGLEGTVAIGAAVVVGAAVGGVLGYLLLSFTVAALSFVVGTFVGLLTASMVVSEAWYVEIAFALAVGAAAAFLGLLLTRSMLIVVTSVVGASFASASLTVGQFQAAQEALALEPLLFDVTSPLFLALVVLGVLTQIGLFKFGYVAKLAAIVPGLTVLPGRSGSDETEPA